MKRDKKEKKEKEKAIPNTPPQLYLILPQFLNI
jgi:hypothetical protein